MRGAERVFAAISDMFEEAPILTLLYDREALGWRFPGALGDHLAAAAAGRRPAQLPAHAAPLPRGREPPAGAPVRRPDQQQQRLRPWPPGAGRRRPPVLLPQPLPLRLARARARPRGDPGRPAGADAGGARDDPPLGPRGQRAGGPLRGQLAAHPRAHQELLRPRGGGRAPAGGDDPLRPRRARGRAAAGVGDRRPQARRGGPRGRPPGAGADRGGGVRSRPRRARRRLSGGPLPGPRGRRASWPGCTRVRGRCWSREWRSSGSPPWRPRPPGGR